MICAYENDYDTGRLAWLERRIPEGRGPAIDVGCNIGATSALLAGKGWSVEGIDLDGGAIASAQMSHPSIRFSVGSLNSAPTGSVELLTCFEVLEHVRASEQLQFMREMRRVTRRSGKLLLSTPGRYSLVANYERLRGRLRKDPAYDWWDPTHCSVLSIRQLGGMLKTAGFHTERISGYHYWPLRLGHPIAVGSGGLARLGFTVLVEATPI